MSIFTEFVFMKIIKWFPLAAFGTDLADNVKTQLFHNALQKGDPFSLGGFRLENQRGFGGHKSEIRTTLSVF